MELKTKIKIVAAAIILLVSAIIFAGMVGSNDDQNWQVVQYPNGTVKIKNEPGWYLTYFGDVWTYPRNVQLEFSKDITKESPADESTRVTFNDGGLADMDTMIRFATPSEEAAQRKFHRLFGGNMHSVKWAVWGHISNVLKATGPLMSASEHQSSRKGEFNQVATDQLSRGLYEMRRVERILMDQTDEKGKPITVFATEIIHENSVGPEGKELVGGGLPRVAQISPYIDFGILVTQFSITEVDYDEKTREQFAQKKDSFLRAESAKAQREQEVQQRLMIEEKGRREKAEVEAIANKEKAGAVINAAREKEVAETNALREKQVAETNAQRQVAVALLEKQTAETNAAKLLEVARLERQAAEEKAKQVIVLANAEKERIQLAGAITEEKKVLAQIAMEQAIGVAKELANVKVPSFVISGGNSANGSSDVQDQLMNLYLLKQMGVLKADAGLLEHTVAK